MSDPGPLVSGVRLALTTFSVAPLRAGRVDRAAAGVAMSVAPLVGGLLGAVLAGVAVGLRELGAPSLVLGAVTVALGLALTRGLHVDGLADTVDGLGSYAGRDRALEIMKSPEVGPFGVAAIVVSLLVQAASVAALAGRPATALLVGVATAAATGRLAVSWACRRGVPAARPNGLGALVAGTVGVPALAGGTIAVAVLAAFAVPGRPWQGPLAVALGVGASALVAHHSVRRLGGITGDVLGALVEVATCATYLVLVLG
ncbi:MAG TPA: adenosylcobinamide-GDP ribazoletransferase [Rugosimonospora sp.]